MSGRCEVCDRIVPDAKPGTSCLCWKCADMTTRVGASGIIARANDMGYKVVFSHVNQAYIIVDERSNNLAGVKNTIQEVKSFLNDNEEARGTEAS